jgi:endonuclease YncB( thermonuclease family)
MSVEVRFCPHCGTRRTGYFRFCGRCGFDFDELRIGPAPESPPAPPKPEPTTPIWPPPIQWPPPDPAPPPQTVTPAPVPQTMAVATPAPAVPAFAVPTPPLLEPAAAVTEPVPGAPVVSRRPALTWTRIAIVALVALLGVNAISRAMTTSQGSAPTPLPTVALGSPLIVESPSSSPSASKQVALTPGPSFGPTGATQAAVVTRIVDGDTIRVDINGTEYPVRYIGIDSPEPDATDPAVKKLADAATATNAALVEGREVVLERDVSETDRFDRLLRNVWLVDGGGSQVLVNLELVRLGFAKVTTFEPDTKYVGLLTTAEAAAKAESLGLWAPTTSP